MTRYSENHRIPPTPARAPLPVVLEYEQDTPDYGPGPAGVIDATDRQPTTVFTPADELNQAGSIGAADELGHEQTGPHYDPVLVQVVNTVRTRQQAPLKRNAGTVQAVQNVPVRLVGKTLQRRQLIISPASDIIVCDDATNANAGVGFPVWAKTYHTIIDTGDVWIVNQGSSTPVAVGYWHTVDVG